MAFNRISTVLYTSYNQEILRGLDALVPMYSYNCKDTMERINLLRSVYDPQDDKRYYHNDTIEFVNYDPSTTNIIDRAVSGLQSYHMNPIDKFFKLRSAELNTTTNRAAVELQQRLSERTDDIHKIIQIPYNFLQETRLCRSKLVLNYGGKVIDVSKDNLVEFFYYPAEATGVASSNGLIWDIYGVTEVLSDFSAQTRFPSTFMPI